MPGDEKMRILWVAIVSLICALAGCCKGPNVCHEDCFKRIHTIAEAVNGPVEFYEVQGDLERARNEDFPDCVIVGKSSFSAPFAGPKKLKRFAAKIGANVILCRRTFEKASVDYECRCNPIEEVKAAPVESHDPNAIEFTSISMTAEFSAAAGPCATDIFAHKIWFLYREAGRL